jgi:hypothetical protein
VERSFRAMNTEEVNDSRVDVLTKVRRHYLLLCVFSMLLMMMLMSILTSPLPLFPAAFYSYIPHFPSSISFSLSHYTLIVIIIIIITAARERRSPLV